MLKADQVRIRSMSRSLDSTKARTSICMCSTRVFKTASASIQPHAPSDAREGVGVEDEPGLGWAPLHQQHVLLGDLGARELDEAIHLVLQ